MALKTGVHVRRASHPRYKWLATFREGGTLRKRYFSTRAEAEKFAEKQEEEALKFGVESSLSEEERSAVIEHRDALGDLNLSLRDAISFSLEYHKKLQRSVPVSQLAEEYQRERREAGASLRYVQDMRSRLRRFTDLFGDRSTATITSVDIEEWLRGLKLSPTSQNNFRRLLVGMFNSAVRRDYCESNPASKVPPVKTRPKPIGILTPAEAESMLHAAESDLQVTIAVGLFAGVRMEEMERLQWESINLEGGYIEIPATQAKSAKRRLIPIQPNLMLWLENFPHREGKFWPSKGRKRLTSLRRAVGFGNPKSLTKKEEKERIALRPWPNNALRHSFASYHLAKFQDAGKLALEMGHTDTTIIFQHYREVVRPEAAETYWSIAPKK